MTYEDYRATYKYEDYMKLSQWQRLRGLIQDWRKSKAPDKRIQFVAIWDATDETKDWIRVSDWWHPKRWHMWQFGIDQCQNFHRIGLGPATILIAT